jgi:hypothetical protein
MATKKKSDLPPSAAKIMEQYRNAGKTGTPAVSASDPTTASETGATPPARPPAPPAAASMRRSGTRGK